MFCLPRIAPVALFLFASTALTTAQTTEKQSTPTPKPAASKSSEPKTAGLTAEELEARKLRVQARSLLLALSSDARAFNDQTLRARSLARIADALWAVDAEQGRLMFRKAWEAAEDADLENERKLQQEIEQQKAKTGGFATNMRQSLRREVLRLAAKNDRSLGEEFLEKLKAQKLEAANNAPRPGRLNESLSQRLSVARELLREGELDRALQFADPALTVAGTESIEFLSFLREKDALSADQRYAALLASSARDPQSDANTVSLLSSYIYTPHLTIIFTKDGVNASQSADKITPADVSPELRNAFFQSAASILLRPLPPPGQPDQTSAGLQGKYMVIKRLLPLFEQSAPTDMTESLRAHLNTLTATMPEERRKDNEEILGEGLRPQKPAADREQSLLDRLERAKTAAERDAACVDLAFHLASQGDMRARDYVSKIDDSEVRKQLQAYIDPTLAMYAVQKKLPDQALEMVQKGELTHLQKVWVLTQTAKNLATTDKEKAVELVEAAGNEARRIDVSDPARPQALIAVANALKVVDTPRAWDATFDAVKAANSSEGFTGEDGEIVLRFNTKRTGSVHTSDVPEFDLEGIFRDLANQDYDRAVELARGFQGEGPRAIATIAIARAILDPKKRKN